MKNTYKEGYKNAVIDIIDLLNIAMREMKKHAKRDDSSAMLHEMQNIYHEIIVLNEKNKTKED